MKKLQLLLSGLLLAGGFVFTSCDKQDNPTVTDVTVADIPSDKEAGLNPAIDPNDINTVIPNFNYTVNEEKGATVIRLDMTGVRDPFTNDWVELYGTKHPKQNVWLSLDDQPKGFSITKVTNDKKSAVDLVFLVDNSSSMSEEANAIARDIIEWSQQLEQTLDVKFGCVGYGGFVSGACNLTTAEKMEEWLNKSTGIMRTRDFADETAEKAQALKDAAATSDYRVQGAEYESYTSMYDPDYSECGVLALRFANDKFSFRNGANRIYVNLTDEPNQPTGKYDLYSTQWVKENWTPTMGTIHTVWTRGASAINTYKNNVGNDYPWDLSIYTDGTVLCTNSNFKDINGNDVHLSDLPVSGAVLNSYIIRFTNVKGVFDGKPHRVKITVKSQSPNGEILAEKVYEITFTK